MEYTRAFQSLFLCSSVVILSVFSASAAPNRVFLPQGWTDADRNWFYSVSQGSELMDLGWFSSLERPSDPPYKPAPKFLADDLQRFGFIPNPDRTQNEAGLPVGFAVNKRQGRAFVGMTCAACHTGQIKSGNVTYQIDGAPGGADFQSFLLELNQSMQQTTQSSARFGRFADSVLSNPGDPVAKAKLLLSLRSYAARFGPYIQKSLPTQKWGPARLDAFGMIFNRVAGYDLQDERNYHLAEAPVSYPFLWGMPWHDKVQWDGSAPNENKVERLARNTGEVLGVFATADLERPGEFVRYYKTSISRRNLFDIEELLLKLKRPKWPQAFGTPKTELVTKGRQYYQTYCSDCHANFNPDQPTKIKVFMDQLTNIKTDPDMVTAAATTKVYTNQLAGVPLALYFGTKLQPYDQALNLVTNVTIGAILWPGIGTLPLPDGNPLTHNDALLAAITTLNLPEEQRTSEHNELIGQLKYAVNLRTQRVEAHEDKGLAYKGRPLDGIWATAPYLHNGSVPTLEDLFKPAKDRPKGFHVGSNKFDPKKVGLDTNASSNFYFNTKLDGNSNTGHEGRWKGTLNGQSHTFVYGTDIPADQKRAILEYLKTL
ncbi:MAG TPA: di-heme-cytochrome C peroxidase [Abditibacteriaceae bacterium]